MTTTIMAAHHTVCRHFYDSMHSYTIEKLYSTLQLFTLDKESHLNISTLYRQEEFLRICQREDLVEKLQETVETILAASIP